MRSLLIILAVAGCATRRIEPPPIDKTLVAKQSAAVFETVSSVHICGAQQTCTSSFPTTTTRYYVVARDGTRCEVTLEEWVAAPLGKSYICPIALAWKR